MTFRGDGGGRNGGGTFAAVQGRYAMTAVLAAGVRMTIDLIRVGLVHDANLFARRRRRRRRGGFGTVNVVGEDDRLLLILLLKHRCNDSWIRAGRGQSGFFQFHRQLARKEALHEVGVPEKERGKSLA